VIRFRRQDQNCRARISSNSSRQPLAEFTQRVDLNSVVQPIRNSARQAANSRSGEAGERGDEGGVYRCSPQPGAEPAVMIIEPNYHCDADDRVPSEISRELR
jgi:hypothetical protein